MGTEIERLDKELSKDSFIHAKIYSKAKLIENSDNIYCFINKDNNEKITSDFTLETFILEFIELDKKSWSLFDSYMDYLPKKIYSEEYINKYVGDIILKLGYIPSKFNNNEYLFNYIYNKGEYKLLFQFTNLNLQEKLETLLDNNTLDLVMNNIMLEFDKHTGLYNRSILLFKKLIKEKKYDKLLNFGTHDSKIKEIFQDELKDIIFPNSFIDNIIENGIYIIFLKNKQIFEKLVSEKKYKLLFNTMDYSLFTKDLLYKHEKEIFEDLEWNDLFSYNFKYSSDMFEFLMEHSIEIEEDENIEQEYIDISEFEITVFDEDLIVAHLDKYGDKIIEAIKGNKLFVDNKEYEYNSNERFFMNDLYNNLIFFEYILKNNYTDLLSNFDKKMYTDEIVTKYSEIIYELVKDKVFLSDEFKNNRALFEKCIEKENYLLAFSSTTLTKEDLEKYYLSICKYIDLLRENELTNKFNYWNSYELLELMIKNDNFEYILMFSSKAFDNDNIIQYYDKIYNLVKDDLEKYQFCSIMYSSNFFKYCLNNNHIELINSIGHNDKIEKIIQENFDKVIEICNINIPDNFFHSTTLLKYYIKNDDKEIVLKFKSDAIDGLGDSPEDIECLKYIDNISKDIFPIEFSASNRLFRYYIDNDDYTHLYDFHSNAFGNSMFMGLDISYLFSDNNDSKSYLKSVLPKIMEHLVDNKLPNGMMEVKEVFEYCLDKNLIPYLIQFSSEVFKWHFFKIGEIEKIILSIKEYNNSIVPLNLISKEIFSIKEIKKYLIEKEDKNLFLQFHFDANKLEELDDELEIYERLLKIPKKNIYEKIEKFYKKNDEVLNTILPFMLTDRFSVFRDDDIEKIILYPDLQLKLYSLNDNELKLVSKIMSFIDNKEFDLTGILVKVLNNIKNYEELINNINADLISEEEIKKIILIIQKSKNIYDITSYEDLKNINQKIDNYFNYIYNKIKNNNIDIVDLKEAIFERKYGLSLEDSKYIVDRYCMDLDAIKNSNIDKRIYNILYSINLIYKCEDIDSLKFEYINSPRTITDFDTIVSLEATIRSMYAKMYTDTLYKLNDKHRLDENNDLYTSNRKAYDLINNSKYNDIHPDIYIMDGDFNLQIHALGAYRDWTVPDNFKDDWFRPKIAYHGICTSYIGNNQIANARANHPIYGFSNYESSAFLTAGNYDLFSDQVISKYDTGYGKPYNIYPPKEMIDNTRHTHNEVVIERRNLTNTGNKRKPDYVVYLVDDINNLDNFSEENQLYSEILQASVDQEIPILIVDRLKYAKSEKMKCDTLLKEFYNDKNYSKLSKCILNYCNNMIGCKKFEEKKQSKYHLIFNKESFRKYINEIIFNTNSTFSEFEKLNVYNTIINSLSDEYIKTEDIYYKLFINEIIKNNNMVINNISNKVIRNNNDEQKLRGIISNYYYSQSDEIQQKIFNDFRNNLSYEEIIYKIENNMYEQNIKR